MREMSTDRPDQTESPYTVDAGHFQLELDFANAVFDHDRSHGGNIRSTSWALAPINLKAGLLNNVDVQFVVDPYVHARVEDRAVGTIEESSGFGDFETRLKLNLWGNDGGTTALALMPFVKWPLPKSQVRNGKIEGGLIVPLAVSLPADWSMCLMTEFDFVRNAQNEGYDADFVNSVTVSHDLVGQLAGYVEFFSNVSSSRNSEWQGQVDVGLTYGIGKNTQFDLGCNFGVTRSAPDFNPFAGFSFRY